MFTEVAPNKIMYLTGKKMPVGGWLHWNVWVESDVTWNIFYASHWLIEKRKEGDQMGGIKNVLNDIWCATRFIVTKP